VIELAANGNFPMIGGLREPYKAEKYLLLVASAINELRRAEHYKVLGIIFGRPWAVYFVHGFNTGEMSEPYKAGSFKGIYTMVERPSAVAFIYRKVTQFPCSQS